MAIPLPVTEQPMVEPLERPVSITITRSYLGTADDFGQGNYLTGHADVVPGFVIAPKIPVDQPGADYFTGMGWREAVNVAFHWTDLSSFFWWSDLEETILTFEQPSPDYFPLAQPIQVTPTIPIGVRLEVTPTVVDAIQIPEPAYEGDSSD